MRSCTELTTVITPLAVLYLEKKYGLLQNMDGLCTPYAKGLGRYSWKCKEDMVSFFLLNERYGCCVPIFITLNGIFIIYYSSNKYLGKKNCMFPYSSGIYCCSFSATKLVFFFFSRQNLLFQITLMIWLNICVQRENGKWWWANRKRNYQNWKERWIH